MAEAHAALIAEAGTITNQTGRTPAELVALVRELRGALEIIADRRFESKFGRSNGQPYYQDRLQHAEQIAIAALKKSEGV